MWWMGLTVWLFKKKILPGTSLGTSQAQGRKSVQHRSARGSLQRPAGLLPSPERAWQTRKHGRQSPTTLAGLARQEDATQEAGEQSTVQKKGKTGQRALAMMGTDKGAHMVAG